MKTKLSTNDQFSLFDQSVIQTILWIEKNVQGKWKFNKKTRLIDVNGSFICSNQELKNFRGVKFGIVTGDFRCQYTFLI